MAKTKPDKDEDSTELEIPEAPNIILTYPMFYYVNDPENLFVLVNTFWASDWDQYFSKEPVPEERKKMIGALATKADTLKQIGVFVAPNKYFMLRDFDDTPLISATLRFPGLNPIDIYLMEGPKYDEKAVEFGIVTVN